jgi:hypothetical protein
MYAIPLMYLRQILLNLIRSLPWDIIELVVRTASVGHGTRSKDATILMSETLY